MSRVNQSKSCQFLQQLCLLRISALKNIAVFFLSILLKPSQPLIALLLSGIPLASELCAASTATNPASNDPSSLPISMAITTKNSITVYEVARQITVRILGDSSSGSGVIVKQQQNTYTVLTSAHVVADSPGEGYTILTGDGFIHLAKRLHIARLKGIDLALIQFTSSHSYQVAELGNANDVGVGAVVYATGFPNWRSISIDIIGNTHNWGLKAFSLTVGRVSIMLNKPLQEGYQLGYTNEIEGGMSGGPVLNNQGKLVGINGRLKYPFQGINAFVFIDGTLPSELLFQQMETLSWAIPITTFQQLTQN